MAQEAIVQTAYADAGTQLLSQHACRLAPQIFLNGGDAKSENNNEIQADDDPYQYA